MGEGRKLSVVGLVNFYLYLYKKVFYWMVSVSSIISSKMSCIYIQATFYWTYNLLDNIICTIESY